jgi:tRNA(fMet)-specific endonuclease VapC
VTGRYLLDTNIVIALLNGEQGVRDSLGQAEEVFVPIIALGELYFGVAKSGQPERNRLIVDGFIEGRVLLSCDLAVARE